MLLILQKNPLSRVLLRHIKVYMRKNKTFTYSEAINDALHIAMQKDKKMICYGLGVTDPKNVFSLREVFFKVRAPDLKSLILKKSRLIYGNIR